MDRGIANRPGRYSSARRTIPTQAWGSATIDCLPCVRFRFSNSAMTSAEEVIGLSGFSGDCGAGCFAIATAPARAKKETDYHSAHETSNCGPLASASYAFPALDTTIAQKSGEADPPPEKRKVALSQRVVITWNSVVEYAVDLSG